MSADFSDARPRRYTAALLKGAGLLGEMHALLACWIPGETDAELLKRVQSDDLLGKQTAARVSDLVKRVFRPRLLANDDQSARWLKYFMEHDGTRETFKEMMLVYSARADDFLYDFVLERFWPSVRRGDLLIRLDDVISFLDEGLEKKHLAKPWSKNVQIKIARGLLSALRDFGLIHEEKQGRREVVNYRMTDTGVTYLLHELHFRGISDAQVVEHSDWRLLGFDRTRVLERLESLSPAAGLVVQRAGSVVRITWAYTSMEAFIDAITR